MSPVELEALSEARERFVQDLLAETNRLEAAGDALAAEAERRIAESESVIVRLKARITELERDLLEARRQFEVGESKWLPPEDAERLRAAAKRSRAAMATMFHYFGDSSRSPANYPGILKATLVNMSENMKHPAQQGLPDWDQR